MRQRLPWISALVATLYITLVLWSDRTGANSVRELDLYGSLAVAALSVAIGWVVSSRLTTDRDRRGIVALIFGMWGPLSATAQFMLALNVHPAFESPLFSACAWTAFCALLAFVASRGRTDLSFATRTIAFAASFLAVTQTVKVVQMRRTIVTKNVRAAARPTGVPDVYLIILDKYSSGQWMRYTYGVDQSAFEDSLRGLGFVVPRAARSNYAHTHLSLASFLNWRYLDVETDGVGGPPWGRTRELIAKARTWEAFREKGYRIFAFPTWLGATNEVEKADVLMRWYGARATHVAETWWINSPLAPLLGQGCLPPTCRGSNTTPYQIETLAEIDWKLQMLTQLPDSSGPVFAFLHLLVAHEPYHFDEQCTPVDPWWPHTDQDESFDVVGRAYAAQVRCFAPRILRTMRTIIARSKVPPVILIQGDHGHARMFTNLLRGFTLTRDEMSKEQVGERHGVFAAYRFPGADSVIADEISPENVMPLVARALWDLPYERLPDRSHFSSYQETFRFTEVPARLTVPPSPK